MTQRRGTSVAALLLVAGVTTLAGPTLAGPAVAAPACPAPDVSEDFSVQDVNADGSSDVVVGVPGAPADGKVRAGAVDVHHPGTAVAPQRVDESFLGQRPAVADGFGSAVAYTRLDVPGGALDRGCADLVVGAPGAADGRGRVSVVRGSGTGLLPSPAVTLTGRHPGDRFGAAVSVFGGDVWIGAPDQEVRGRVGAGAVYHYRVTGDGTLTFVQAISEDTPGIPGTAEVGDHFGRVLSAYGSGLLVGQPDEDAGRIRDAGAVTVLALSDPQGDIAAAGKVSENTRGVPGVAAAGDRFGASASCNGTAAVGIPGAEVRDRRDAGAVQTFSIPGRRPATLVPLQRVTQESPTIPGASEVGDRFGASVLTGNGDALWIGVPGEGLGGEPATGEVVRTHLGRRLSSFGSVIRLGGRGPDNVPGSPQRGSHVGVALATEAPVENAEGGGGGETVVVSVPGANGTRVGSGEVWVSRSTPNVTDPDHPVAVVAAAGTYTDSDGPRAHEHYGAPATSGTNGAPYGN